jgi:hypothetical protein
MLSFLASSPTVTLSVMLILSGTELFLCSAACCFFLRIRAFSDSSFSFLFSLIQAFSFYFSFSLSFSLPLLLFAA